MMDIRKDGRTVEAFGYSLALVSLLSTMLAIVKEKSEPVMSLMKAATGHHWITHGIVVLIAFVVLGFVFEKTIQRPSDASRFNRAAAAILASTIVSGLLLAAFYIFWA